MKKRLLGALSSIPFTALAMSGSYAAGCPYGVLNCPYPGQCPRYVDLNGNGLCDLSLDDVNTQTDTPMDLILPGHQLIQHLLITTIQTPLQ
jgi:hypothetical protein